MRAQLWEEEDSVQLYPGPTHGSSDTIGRGRRGKAPCLACSSCGSKCLASAKFCSHPGCQINEVTEKTT